MTPSEPLDDIWHAHILDTKKYAEDCDKIFGKFLHHFPYLGMRGAEDKLLLEENYDTTKSLFRKELGIEIDVAKNGKASTCYGKCGNTPTKCRACRTSVGKGSAGSEARPRFS